jgi:hypothetical protein
VRRRVAPVPVEPPSEHAFAGQPANQALAQRLRAAAEVLIDTSTPPAGADPWRDAGRLLSLLVDSVHADLSRSHVAVARRALHGISGT